jgi:hypothetical protein
MKEWSQEKCPRQNFVFTDNENKRALQLGQKKKELIIPSHKVYRKSN